MEELDSIDLRSKEFQEVIGEPPGWLLNWGITAILIAFIALCFFGYFFKYPVTISAPVKLVTSNPPVEIAAPALGNLTSILPEDTVINEGTTLAMVVDDFGDYEDILRLEMVLQNYKVSKRNIPNFAEIDRWDLGPVKSDFLKFFQAFVGTGIVNAGAQSQAFAIFDGRIATIKEEINDLEKQIAQKEKRLKQIPSLRESFKNTYIETKLEEDNLKLHRLREEQLSLEEGIDLIKVQIASKEREIQEQEFQKSNYLQGVKGKQITKKQNIAISLNTLQTTIEEWKGNHLIKAPISGKLLYQDKIKAKEFLVEKGQRIFAIEPPGAKDIIEGKLYLSSEESIKIKEGQKVKIKFSAYRPSEFGLLNGTISDKAPLPENGQYQVTVSLDNGMLSSKEKTITFEHQMQGEANIITEDRRFTGLIFDQFKEMLRRE